MVLSTHVPLKKNFFSGIAHLWNIPDDAPFMENEETVISDEDILTNNMLKVIFFSTDNS